MLKFLRSWFRKRDELDRIKAKWAEECPEFDDFEYQKIIDWLAVDKKGDLAWENTFVSYKNGVRTTRVDDKLAHWSFVWKFGFLGFMSFKKDEEERAKKCVAMFVWLWLKKKVPAQYADHLAEAYCRKYTFSRG